uniref:Hydroxymethylglutaryl-CoA synthase n=2 Tax=Spongospora subterranea TaxID=70186 RepID=A0A0H5R8R5_9EUKA|eukprot:CRZ10518.1 hypothetical protein [Spongospora subterranea]
MSTRVAANVGIVAMEVYIPKNYVSQQELEQFEQVSAGKFTLGLGQERMAFVNDLEDIYSISLTVVQSLMEKYSISYSDIGRLEVGTETIIDHSKSVKSVIMQLFDPDHSDVEGIDNIHACYGGTNALFNAVAWVESSVWDGKYALVVAADIAEYASGPARPTGGVGAVAMLIGADAPMVLDIARGSHMEHAYDFYKPNLSSPYPVVDGHFSNICYLNSLDKCYERYKQKMSARGTCSNFNMNSNADYVVFHAPYNKLVQKSFARLLYNDFLNDPSSSRFESIAERASAIKPDDDRQISDVFGKFSAEEYAQKIGPSTILPRNLGNMYAASLYAGLASLVSSAAPKLTGKRIVMFSYGSGIASSMFSFAVRQDPASVGRVAKMQECLDIDNRLGQRQKQSPAILEETLACRDKLHTVPSFKPSGSTDWLFPGTYFLANKDSKSRRFYERHC